MLLFLGSFMQNTPVGYGSATQQKEWASNAAERFCQRHACCL